MLRRIIIIYTPKISTFVDIGVFTIAALSDFP